MIVSADAKLRGESVFINLVATAIGAFLLGAIGWGVSKAFGLNGNQQLMAAGAVLLVGLLVAVLFLLRVVSLRESAGDQYMSERTGVIRTFRNLHECKEDMQAEFKRAEKIRLLLLIGRLEIGSMSQSFFHELFKDKGACEIKILRASPDSPFFSDARANDTLKKNPARWRENLEHVAKEISFLKKTSKATIEDRTHSEPPLWRIFIFGDVAYVSGYQYLSENDSKSPVYKLTKEGENSLYPIFLKYFDYLWLKSDPQGPAEPNERWKGWK